MAVVAVFAFVVPIFVAIVADGFGTVEDDGQLVEAFFRVVLLDVWQERLLEEVSADDEEGHIRPMLDDIGIGDDLNWRTIDEDIVVLLAQFGNQFTQSLRREEFSWVRRQFAGRQDVNGLVDDELMEILFVATEVINDAPMFVTIKCLGEGLLTEVQIEGNHSPTVDGK